MDVQTVTDETQFSGPSKGSPSFYVGLDLESYSGRGKSQLFSGKFTANDDIYYNPIVGQHGVAAGVTMVFDAFAHYDSVIGFENDTALHINFFQKLNFNLLFKLCLN